MNPRLRVLVRMVGSKQRWRVRKRPTPLSFDEDGNTVVNPARAGEGAEDVPTADSNAGGMPADDADADAGASNAGSLHG